MSWEGKSKGTVLGYKIFVFTIRRLGVRFAYFISWFVSTYFYLRGGKEKEAIKTFYLRDLKVEPSKVNKLIRKNFSYLGHTLIDKIAFLIGRGHFFDFDFDGHHHLKKLIKNDEPAALIGAHIGNYEIAGNMLQSKELGKNISAVMYENEHAAIKEFLDSETGGASFNIIAIKPNDLSYVLQISAALKNKEFIGIHGDRFMPGARTLKATFLGKEASFPAGPFEIASKLNAPATFVYAMKVHKKGYKFYGTEPIREKTPAQEILNSYVKCLEGMVRKYPEQWYNYYDFFNIEDASK